MAGYDENELRRLQSDAARRVQDMQQRSRRASHEPERTAARENMPPSGGRRSDPHTGNVRTERMNMPGFGRGGERHREEPQIPPPQKPAKNGLLSQLFGHGGKSGGFDLSKIINLKGLSLDGDLSLILTIVLMISGEEVDELLLMALIYIML